MEQKTDGRQLATRAGAGFAQFDEAARRWLLENRERIEHELILNGFPEDCEWHPNGFAVADLPWVAPFSRVRIHTWSRAVRVVFPDHPPVHSHDRHITSCVLAGRYDDALYDVWAAGSAEPAAQQRYTVRKRTLRGVSGSGDTLVGTDEYVRVAKLENRTVRPGEIHAIPAGMAHEVLTPPTQFCLTVAVKGELTGQNLEFVVDQPGRPDRLIGRRQLTRAERAALHREMIDQLALVAGRRA